MTRRIVCRWIFYLVLVGAVGCIACSIWIITMSLQPNPGAREILILLPFFAPGALVLSMILVVVALEDPPVLTKWERRIVSVSMTLSLLLVGILFILGATSY